MDVVTCPNCGQMQARAENGKCIKCGADILPPARKTIGVGPETKWSLEKVYLCPKCGFAQTGEQERCKKCNHSMIHDHPFLSTLAITCRVFGVILIASSFFMIWIGSMIKMVILSFAASVPFFLLAIPLSKQARKKGTKIEKPFPKQFSFCGADGIPGMGLQTNLTMLINLDKGQLQFVSEDGIERVLSLDQVQAISFGSYTQKEIKQFTGGISVGHVFIHGSPVSEKVYSFFQIKYVPKGSAHRSEIIQLILPELATTTGLSSAMERLGIPLDDQYIVKKYDTL